MKKKSLDKSPLLFTKIERKDPLAEEIYNQISNAILNGDLQPGDKLVEERVGEQFGVSRVPVRDAIQLLEKDGLVEKIPYHGTFVAKLSERTFIELHSVRVALEKMAVEILANRNSPKDIGFLNGIIARMKEVAANDNRKEILIIDANFHDALINLTNHSVLKETWQPIGVRLRCFLYLKRHHTHKRIEDVVESHLKIVKGIASGNTETAVAALDDHLQQVEDKFTEAISQGKSIF